MKGQGLIACKLSTWSLPSPKMDLKKQSWCNGLKGQRCFCSFSVLCCSKHKWIELKFTRLLENNTCLFVWRLIELLPSNTYDACSSDTTVAWVCWDCLYLRADSSQRACSLRSHAWALFFLAGTPSLCLFPPGMPQSLNENIKGCMHWGGPEAHSDRNLFFFRDSQVERLLYQQL